ncbi:MAG: HEAT repeat domain-containing protein [Myxococcales bacterium]|nr:HEAT repeat domain-containing protein [Myxococcales bacterium]
MMWLAFPLQVALACALPPRSAPPDIVSAQITVCVQDARDPAWQKHNPAITVLGLIGEPSVAPIDHCIGTEKDDEARARCVRALGENHTTSARERLLHWAAQHDLGPNTTSALASALGSTKDPRALPLLGRFVIDDGFPSHSAAIALFDIDPSYYTRLPTAKQVAYAVGIADTGYLQVHHSATFLAHAPALARILAQHIRSGNVALGGKDVLLSRWLHLLEQVGSAAQAQDVLSVLQHQTDDAVQSRVFRVLLAWHSPLGLAEAQNLVRSAIEKSNFEGTLAVDSACTYLRGLAADRNGEAAAALFALWQFNGLPETRSAQPPQTPSPSSTGGSLPNGPASAKLRASIRCLLVWSYQGMRPRPPAVEVAELLESPCHHDMSILLNTPDPYLIDGIVDYLGHHRKETGQGSILRSALAWQCAKRFQLAPCKKAAPYLQGVRRPVHED